MANDYMKLRRVANQACPRVTITEISWDTEDVDDSGYFTSGAATKLLTVPTGKAGKFILCALAGLDGNAPEEEACIVYNIYNSSNTLLNGIRRPHGHQDNLGTSTAELTLADGDYVKFVVYHSWNSGTRQFTGGVEMLRLG